VQTRVTAVLPVGVTGTPTAASTVGGTTPAASAAQLPASATSGQHITGVGQFANGVGLYFKGVGQFTRLGLSSS
jgi:hypothetical protein